MGEALLLLYYRSLYQPSGKTNLGYIFRQTIENKGQTWKKTTACQTPCSPSASDILFHLSYQSSMAELFHVSCISRLKQIKTSAAQAVAWKAQWPTSSLPLRPHLLLLHLSAITLQQCQKKQAGSGAMDRLTQGMGRLVSWYLDLASAVEASASESESASASALEAWARAGACSATSSPNQSRPVAWAAA